MLIMHLIVFQEVQLNMAARTPNSKFAAPFKSPSMTNSRPSSATLLSIRGATSRCGESRSLLPPPGDQQQHQKPRGKDILTGLSQDSNMSQSVKLFVTPTLRSPVAKQSTPRSKVSLTGKGKKVSNNDDDNGDLSHGRPMPIHETNIPQSIRIEPASKSNQYHRGKSTKSRITKIAESIQPTNQEVAPDQTQQHSTDTPLIACATDEMRRRHIRKYNSSADTELISRNQDVYKFPMSPNSLQMQRQRIRKLQTRVRNFNSIY